MRIRKVLSALLALVLAAVLLPAVQAPARAQLFGVSEQQEIQIGREVERQLARKPGFVNDPALTQYVTGIGLKLAKVSERPTLPWTYHVLQDTQVNALAAPGGFIFVTRGLLRFVQSDSELAFVLGHETTHVAHRHAVELAQRDMELQFGAVLLTQLIFGGKGDGGRPLRRDLRPARGVRPHGLAPVLRAAPEAGEAATEPPARLRGPPRHARAHRGPVHGAHPDGLPRGLPRPAGPGAGHELGAALPAAAHSPHPSVG